MVDLKAFYAQGSEAEKAAIEELLRGDALMCDLVMESVFTQDKHGAWKLPTSSFGRPKPPRPD